MRGPQRHLPTSCTPICSPIQRGDFLLVPPPPSGVSTGSPVLRLLPTPSPNTNRLGCLWASRTHSRALFCTGIFIKQVAFGDTRTDQDPKYLLPPNTQRDHQVLCTFLGKKQMPLDRLEFHPHLCLPGHRMPMSSSHLVLQAQFPQDSG